MAYADLGSFAALDELPAATMTQARDNDEFLVEPPVCSVFHNTTQSYSTGITPQVVLANSEDFDNFSGHSTSTNTSRITVATAGKYRANALGYFANNVTGNRALIVRVNGTTSYSLMVTANAGGNSTVLNGTKLLSLAANDYVETLVWQNSGGNLDFTLTEFSLTWAAR